jgi:hypothetical protein
MPLSKLWLFLLSLLCALPALLLLGLDPELRRREVEEQTQRLLRAHEVATELLQNQAQKLVVAAVQMSSDAVLQNSLNEMGSGQSELPILHTTAQSQLQKLNADFGADLLLVTDARGRVLARVGHDQAVYRDPLDGFPLVEAALRGYRLDDLWLLDGVLYRVAASPVVAPGHDRYTGALVIGQVLGGEMARLLQRMTGVGAAFLAGGQTVASTLKGEPLDAQLLLAARATGVTALPKVKNSATPQAAVVRGPQPGPERLLSFVDMPGAAAQQGAVLVLIGEVTTERTLPGLLRDAVQHGRPLVGLLGLFGMVVLLYATGLGILSAENARNYVPTVGGRSAPAAGPAEQSAGPPRQSSPPTPPRPLPLAGPLMAVVSGTSAHSAETVVASPMLWPPEADPEPEPEPEPEQFATAATPWELPPPNSNFEPTLVGGAQAVHNGADPDASFYQVFQAYVLLRERCHESVEGISYEQFRHRLQESRAQIMQQYGCRGVDFQVYIKEGRAALRATPLWK